MIQPRPYRFSVDEFQRMSELEVYRQPEAGRYGDLRILDEGQAISPLLLDLEVVWWG